MEKKFLFSILEKTKELNVKNTKKKLETLKTVEDIKLGLMEMILTNVFLV